MDFDWRRGFWEVVCEVAIMLNDDCCWMSMMTRLTDASSLLMDRLPVENAFDLLEEAWTVEGVSSEGDAWFLQLTTLPQRLSDIRTILVNKYHSIRKDRCTNSKLRIIDGMSCRIWCTSFKAECFIEVSESLSMVRSIAIFLGKWRRLGDDTAVVMSDERVVTVEVSHWSLCGDETFCLRLGWGGEGISW